MQRHAAQSWIWCAPNAPEVPYATVCLKGGQTYAGPADAIVPFADTLVEGATMLICDRAEALRAALRGSVE